MIIRDECAADIGAIRGITLEAFADHPFGNQMEQYIIDALRADAALTISPAAEVEGRGAEPR